MVRRIHFFFIDFRFQQSNGSISPPVIIDSSISENKSDICSPDNHTLDISEDHQQTSSVTSPVPFVSQSRTNGINSTVDQLIPRLIDYIKKQNDIDLHSIANQVFK